MAQTSTCSPADSALPVGAFAQSTDDPMIPAYCVPSPAVHAPTRVTGANDWVDAFDIQGVARLNDGDMGYRVFDGAGGIAQSKHLVVGDHWIDDNKLQYNGGAMLRPDRTFSAENGKLVIEGDAASGKQVYGGDQWIEFTISTSARPDVNTADAPEQGYAYGRFHGFPTFGCRFQNGGENTCAGFTGSPVQYPGNGLAFNPTNDKPPCFSLASDRLWELSFFQDCGNNFGGTHWGGFSDQANSVWRSCAPGSDYDPCLDRFRIELTQSSLVLYVNGIRYFEDSGWDSAHQLPASLFQNAYVYFDDWGQGPGPGSVRFHWGRLAVNPHDAAGHIVPPSAAPSFNESGPSSPPTTSPVASTIPGAATSPDKAAAAAPLPEVTTTGIGQTVTFNDLVSPDRPLKGSYPSGVIDWGSDWYLSGPWGKFTTSSISFTKGPTSASFTLGSGLRLAQLAAYNGGTDSSEISVSCTGQPTKEVSLTVGELSTIVTNWTAACANVTVGSSNGWDTNFNDLVVK